MKVISRMVLAASFMFASMANADVILSLSPTEQTSPGDELVSFMLSVEGLGDGVELSMQGFNIDLQFETSALALDSVNFSDALGDWNLWEAFGSVGLDATTGIVSLFNQSLLDNAFLVANQPGSFNLAEIFFRSVAPATSTVSIVGALLTEASGDASAIAVNAVNNAQIEVSAPTTLTLMGLALMAMFVRQKRQTKA